MRTSAVLFLCLFTLVSCKRYERKSGALLEEENHQVIVAINDLLKERYVFPELGEKMSDHLHSKYVAGAYSKITQAKKFANTLTEDLQSVSKDKHLRVIFDPDKVLEMREAEVRNDKKAVIKLQMAQMEESNFGFKKVQILEGNIGYINLTNFYDAEYAGVAAVAAMDQIKDTDAIIIDLRENGGGYPSMIQLLSSYFFDQPVHLNSFYFRPSDSYEETWTHDQVRGERRPDVPIFILTSEYTFSAAEEFAYNLQNLKRATIVGEVTGGGAHPGGMKVVSDRFLIWIPTGRAINPITNTNWEGTGIIPDVRVSSKKALQVALNLIKEKSIAG